MSSAPTDPSYAHIARAQELLRARDPAGARHEADLALRKPPADFVARNALGSVLYELGDLATARDLFQGVLAENPHYADALNNLGNVLALDGKPRAAVEFYERALAAAPSNADYLANLGGVRQALGDVDGALLCFERALAADPNHADARWNRAIARLLSGDLVGGFADYEARWSLPEFTARHVAVPKWTGEDLGSKTILIHSEQGYGDTIQMARFAKLLVGQGARVLFETHAPLAHVLRAVDGIDRVIVAGEALPPFDLHVPAMSLPGLCRVAAIGDIPAAPAYIHAPNDIGIDLPPRESGVVRVGLVWAGRATHKNDRNRSVVAAQLAGLAHIPNVQLVSLQVGASSKDLAAFGQSIDLAPQLVDFAVTAAALAQLDLVISVDTAVAHLAGAMGKEAWVLLPFAPDWRWLLRRNDSPWYPSLRLYRQPRLGDWAEPIARVVADLTARAAR